MYNLTVDTTHTYYVIAGNIPVLVHNSNSCIIPVPGMKPLSAAEEATGQRLMAASEYRGGVLSQSPHVGADFVDQNGTTYDAIGQPGGYSHWNQDQFLSALDEHVNYPKGDYTVLDLTGASSSQMDVIFSHIDSTYTSEQRATIIIVGD
jgi:hypothetical protein